MRQPCHHLARRVSHTARQGSRQGAGRDGRDGGGAGLHGIKGRIALFGCYFADGADRFQGYRFAYSHAPFHPLEHITEELGKVAIAMDRASSPRSAATRRLTRKHRVERPGNYPRLIFLPRGSPYLDVVGVC